MAEHIIVVYIYNYEQKMTLIEKYDTHAREHKCWTFWALTFWPVEGAKDNVLAELYFWYFGPYKSW